MMHGPWERPWILYLHLFVSVRNENTVDPLCAMHLFGHLCIVRYPYGPVPSTLLFFDSPLHQFHDEIYVSSVFHSDDSTVTRLWGPSHPSRNSTVTRVVCLLILVVRVSALTGTYKDRSCWPLVPRPPGLPSSPSGFLYFVLTDYDMVVPERW